MNAEQLGNIIFRIETNVETLVNTKDPETKTSVRKAIQSDLELLKEYKSQLNS